MDLHLHIGLIEINLTTLMILVNIFILYIILKKYFWEKIKAFMDDRSNAIKDAIDGAEAMNRRADAKMANYSKRIANIEDEGRAIIKDARAQADVQAQQIIADARAQAAAIIEKAERTIELERTKAMDDMRQEIASIGLMVAEQIVEKEVQRTGQEAIVDEVINNARSTQWQN